MSYEVSKHVSLTDRRRDQGRQEALYKTRAQGVAEKGHQEALAERAKSIHLEQCKDRLTLPSSQDCRLMACSILTKFISEP